MKCSGMRSNFSDHISHLHIPLLGFPKQCGSWVGDFHIKLCYKIPQLCGDQASALGWELQLSFRTEGLKQI